MRIAVFSDIHGNRAALDAVFADIDLQRPDVTVCGGDLAFGGPDPEGSVQRVIAVAAPCVRGNTDEWLTPTATERDPIADWTRARLSSASRRYLAALPFDHRLDDLVIVHATPWSVSDLIRKDAGAPEIRRVLAEARAAAVVYGHIHLPWIGEVSGGGLLVNAGSVGFPFDGDPRPSYALLEKTPSGWRASIRRIVYDTDRAAASMPEDHPAREAWARRMRTGRRDADA
jgi:putative phosphoesterase